MNGGDALQVDAGGRTTAVVDLFCGAGGLAYGLKLAGLTVKAGVDLDPSCRHPLEKEHWREIREARRRGRYG